MGVHARTRTFPPTHTHTHTHTRTHTQYTWFGPASDPASSDWPSAWRTFDDDWEEADLIWNGETRAELSRALLDEITTLDALLRQFGLLSTTSWDSEGFEVEYPSRCVCVRAHTRVHAPPSL